MKQKAFPKISYEAFIIAIGILLVVSNLFFTLVYCKNKWNYHMPFNFEPGYQFSEFKDKVKGQPAIGFMTNKDLSQGKNDGNFLQAQYFLAPTLIKLNDDTQRFQILDYSNQLFMFYVLKRQNAVVLGDNIYGQVLIQKKDQ